LFFVVFWTILLVHFLINVFVTINDHPSIGMGRTLLTGLLPTNL